VTSPRSSPCPRIRHRRARKPGRLHFTVRFTSARSQHYSKRISRGKYFTQACGLDWPLHSATYTSTVTGRDRRGRSQCDRKGDRQDGHSPPARFRSFVLPVLLQSAVGHSVWKIGVSLGTRRGVLVSVMTCAADGLTHSITDHESRYGLRRGRGIYQAMCGREIIADALGSPPGPVCPRCCDRGPAIRVPR
jgi:hypothetical protein